LVVGFGSSSGVFRRNHSKAISIVLWKISSGEQGKPELRSLCPVSALNLNVVQERAFPGRM